MPRIYSGRQRDKPRFRNGLSKRQHSLQDGKQNYSNVTRLQVFEIQISSRYKGRPISLGLSSKPRRPLRLPSTFATQTEARIIQRLAKKFGDRERQLLSGLALDSHGNVVTAGDFWGNIGFCSDLVALLHKRWRRLRERRLLLT